MKYTRAQLEEYASPISDSENETCKRAIRMVRDALVNSGYDLDDNLRKYDEQTYYYEKKDKFGGTLTILLQGSYANKTNIKHTSDVDISILYKSLVPYSFSKYKDNLFNALKLYFGSEKVHRKNKSLKVDGNSGRKEIDVVPAFYETTVSDGIYFITDSGERIVNYPLQHISNAKIKNGITEYNYKRYVRIFKNLKRDLNYNTIGSFQTESLLWNLPDSLYKNYTYCLESGVKDIINYLYANKLSIKNFKEGNGIKQLIKGANDYNNICDLIDEFRYRVEV